MRELGIIIWVVFIVIGVFANIASAVRKQQQAASKPPPGTPQPVRQPQVRMQTMTWPASATAAPTPTTVAPVSPASVRRPQAPPARVAPAGIPLAALHEAPARRSRPFFADGPSLVRGIIAAEVLGKPRALRDE